VTPRHFAVIGDPIAHSKSPAMHQAAFRTLGLPHTYEAVRASAEDLPSLVRALRDGGFDGLNVTVPHKNRVLALVDAVDGSAARVGAANTLVRDASGRIVAHNTDERALETELLELDSSLAELMERDRMGGAIVLGAGGAARAAIAALDALGIGPIVVRARDAARGAAVAAEMRAALGTATQWIAAEPLAPGAGAGTEREVEVIVQASSAGMTGAEPGDAVARAVAWDLVPSDASALDVVYAPPETPFLRAARARGLHAAGGLGMLARQGALAFELWLGIPAPFAAMRAALLG
jgi:shikimate dehydrogenase